MEVLLFPASFENEWPKWKANVWIQYPNGIKQHGPGLRYAATLGEKYAPPPFLPQRGCVTLGANAVWENRRNFVGVKERKGMITTTMIWNPVGILNTGVSVPILYPERKDVANDKNGSWEWGISFYSLIIYLPLRLADLLTGEGCICILAAVFHIRVLQLVNPNYEWALISWIISPL